MRRRTKSRITLHDDDGDVTFTCRLPTTAEALGFRDASRAALESDGSVPERQRAFVQVCDDVLADYLDSVEGYETEDGSPFVWALDRDELFEQIQEEFFEAERCKVASVLMTTRTFALGLMGKLQVTRA